MTPESLGRRLHRRIRTDIIFGRLPPGQKLKLDEMAREYDVSISTLRELFNRLSSEGFLTAEGMRGFEVTPVSALEFRELARMRQLLECHAIENSFRAGDLEWEGRVMAAHHKLSLMEKRMMGGDRSESELWKHYDREFHHALISACGSEALLDTHSDVYDKYLRYQVIAIVFRGAVAAEEHQQLLQCALRRDVASAKRILSVHIHECVEDTIRRGALS